MYIRFTSAHPAGSNVRAGTSTQAEIVGQVFAGDLVRLIDREVPGWLHIEYERGEGWVYETRVLAWEEVQLVRPDGDVQYVMIPLPEVRYKPHQLRLLANFLIWYGKVLRAVASGKIDHTP